MNFEILTLFRFTRHSLLITRYSSYRPHSLPYIKIEKGVSRKLTRTNAMEGIATIE
ncbi:MAG TPA: hypothetical protein VJK54_10050 [Chthoniobacterales bacterium]|nr:hypothetical protein [Chthoniobacterales bacterium]